MTTGERHGLSVRSDDIPTIGNRVRGIRGHGGHVHGLVREHLSRNGGADQAWSDVVHLQTARGLRNSVTLRAVIAMV